MNYTPCEQKDHIYGHVFYKLCDISFILYVMKEGEQSDPLSLYYPEADFMRSLDSLSFPGYACCTKKIMPLCLSQGAIACLSFL